MKKEFLEKFNELGISIVYLFGSRAVGKGTPLSDMDIGVVLKDLEPNKDTRTLYHVLYEVFSKLYPASKLDIVLLQAAPLPLQYSAIRDGKILYEQDPRLTANYEYRIINQYLDFRPVLDYFDRIATERYAKA